MSDEQPEANVGPSVPRLTVFPSGSIEIIYGEPPCSGIVCRRDAVLGMRYTHKKTDPVHVFIGIIVETHGEVTVYQGPITDDARRFVGYLQAYLCKSV